MFKLSDSDYKDLDFWDEIYPNISYDMRASIYR